MDINNKHNVKLKDIIKEYKKYYYKSDVKRVSIGKEGISFNSFYENKIIDKNKLIFKNTITFGFGTKLIEFGILDEEKKYLVSSAYKTFFINEKVILPIYLNYFLRSNLMKISHNYLLISSRQGKNIDYNNFLKLKIPLIDINKQKKVGEFLSNIDNFIQFKNKKLNFLIEYKNRILDLIFNNKNLNLIKFNNLVSMKHGSRPMPLYDKKFYSKDGVPYIQVSDFKNSNYITKSKWNFNKLGQKYSYFVPKNSLLMTSGATIGKIAYNSFDACISDGIIHFYDFKCDEKFFFYLLQSKNKEFNLLSNSSTMKRLSSNNLQNWKIKLPIFKIMIQKNIGKLLFNIDKLIQLENKKVKNYIEFKKNIINSIFIM